MTMCNKNFSADINDKDQRLIRLSGTSKAEQSRSELRDINLSLVMHLSTDNQRKSLR